MVKKRSTRKKVIFTVGTSRSGSTILNLILGNSSSGLSLGEIHALFRPWRPHHIKKRQKVEAKNKEKTKWHEIINSSEKELYAKIFKNTDYKYVVDSSKNPVWIRDQIKYSKNKKYIIKPIVIYKSPVQFAYSMYKRDRIDEWKYKWKETYKNLFYVLEEIVSVKYSQLANNPKSKTKKLCETLDIEYEKGMEMFWKNDQRFFHFGSKGVRESKEFIEYERQYKKNEIKEAKKRVKSDIDGEIKKINHILENKEVYRSVTGTDKKNITKEVSELGLNRQVKLELQSTNCYVLNRTSSVVKKLLKKLL